MATVRQIAANRQNATRSTGPRTREGKETSRGNALKHGLAGKGIVLPDEETQAAKVRAAEWGPCFKPSGEFELWLVEVVATESVRIDLCFTKDIQIREAKARRAAACWEEDRRAEVEKLASRIAKRPEIVARELRRSAQGVDLLIERWECLADAVARTGDWDESQRSMALDLLGVAHVLRSGRTALDAPEGRDVASWLTELADRELKRLLGRRPALDELDGYDEAKAIMGLDVRPDPELNRLRRYEAGCKRRLQWAYMKLKGRGRRAGWTERDRKILGDGPTPPGRQPSAVGRQPGDRKILDAGPAASAVEPDFRTSPEFLAVRAALAKSRAENAAGSVAIVPPPSAPVPARPLAPVPVPNPFPGNRRARRAAMKMARSR